MGIWKKLFAFLLATRAYNVATKRPTVVVSPGYTIVNMEPLGLGTDWRISFYENSKPNLTFTVKIHKGMRVVSSYGAKFNIQYPNR